MPSVTMTIKLRIMLMMSMTIMMNRVAATHTSHAGVMQRGEPILVLPVHLGARFIEVPGIEIYKKEGEYKGTWCK